MKRTALVLLAAASLASAGPTAEISTDGIRLGWRFGDLHGFLKGDFDLYYESSRYRRSIGDSVATERTTDEWDDPYGAIGCGIDWLFHDKEVAAGLRAEADWAPISYPEEHGFIISFRAGPLLEKRWDRIVIGASSAPALEWSRYESDRVQIYDGLPNRIAYIRNYLTIDLSSELHLRYEF